jgi:hypothetical protein
MVRERQLVEPRKVGLPLHWRKPEDDRGGTESVHEAHPEYPLERVCVHLYEPFQLKFARHAEQILSVTCELEVEIGDHGLTLRGETESELELAATILRNFYGYQIRIGPLRVRYHRGEALEEPFMGVRVRCDIDWTAAVKADLIARRAVIVSSELVRGTAFVRALAPLARLIGFPTALRMIAGASARQLMWLSHYAPAQGPETASARGAGNCLREEDTHRSDVDPRYDSASGRDTSPASISRGRLGVVQVMD